MKISDKLKKALMFIIPHLLYVALFSYFYNSTYTPVGDAFEILFREIFILSFIYFIIFSILYFILRIKIDEKRCFFILLAFILLSFEIVYKSLLMWIVVFLLLIILLVIKDNIREKIIFFTSYVVVMLFLFNFIPSAKYAIYNVSRYNNEDVKLNIKLNDNDELPNIYWIHCDGMINFNDAEKFFEVDNSYFKEYLEDNDYYINEDATFDSHAHTIQALVALYNPRYYDEIFGKYLNNLNNSNFKDDIISYDFMKEKRLNNELFEALYKKNYKIATISDFNQYASFYTDYMFDYYSFQKSKEKDLDYFTSKDNSYEDIVKYSDYSHLKTLADTTFLHYFTDDFNFLKHKEIDYNEMDYSNYKYINKTEYWKSKAILKSLSMVYEKKDDRLFTFIDYSINHTPWLYDKSGKVVNTNKEGFLPDNFADNYVYSTYILSDILTFIKDNDKDSIIILQSDHGIHTVLGINLALYTGYSLEEVDKLVDSTFSAIYIPEKYLNSDEEYLSNPLNISRYLVNNFVGDNYKYLE